MLYAIPCAALTAALAVACWRSRIYRRALLRQTLAARLTEAAWARDTAALEHHLAENAERAERERDVLARAALIVDIAFAATRTDQQHPGGGPDGRRRP